MQEYTLQDCLDEYVLPERLGAGVYHCKSCGSNEEALKQLSIKTLPPTLSIQFKVIHYTRLIQRFKHSEKSSSKIDTFVKIPLTLDMTPQTTRMVKTRTILTQAMKARSPKPHAFDPVTDGIPTYKYSLFALICHEGKLDTGHYKAYCRVRNDWFLFDDHNITTTDISVVLKANVYMCFYIRDHAEYAPSDVVDKLESANSSAFPDLMML